MKVIVIGGGPAGMIASVATAEKGNEVILLEKMDRLGKKLLITGKGRCNITSSLNMEEFIKNIPGNGKFLYSCFQRYTNLDIINFLEEQGLKVKEERGNRIFPQTDKSIDVLNCFIKKLKQFNVQVKLNTKVTEILEENGQAVGVKINNGEKIYADKIILATGGKSYPLTGSTGDGYVMAEKLGHTIQKIKPSLVPIELYNKKEISNLQGLSLRNTAIKIIDSHKNKIIYEDFGEMIFTHFGVSGPIILSGSAHLIRYNNLEQLLQEKNIKIFLDLKPALTEEKLEERILRDFNELKNKQYKNSLDKLLPQKMIKYVIEKSKINPDKKVNEITKEERKRLVHLLKNMEFEIKDFRPIDEAIITSGGINIKEIDPKTLESKLINGLYFAGEVIDVDAYTGGFNLQIAYSTGYVAGQIE